MAWELPAFAWLGTLGHLDLQFIGVDQIFASYAKSTGSYLFDGASFGISVRQKNIAFWVFSAFARIAFAANAVHGNRQAFMGFFTDRPVRHGAGLESPHDFFYRLHFLNRDRFFSQFEFQKTSKGRQIFGLLIDQGRIFLKHFEAVEPTGQLKFMNRVRIKEVMFAVIAPLIASAGIEDTAVG